MIPKGTTHKLSLDEVFEVYYNVQNSLEDFAGLVVNEFCKQELAFWNYRSWEQFRFDMEEIEFESYGSQGDMCVYFKHKDDPLSSQQVRSISFRFQSFWKAKDKEAFAHELVKKTLKERYKKISEEEGKKKEEQKIKEAREEEAKKKKEYEIYLKVKRELEEAQPTE